MNRIDAIFSSRRAGSSLLVPYVCAGDPDLAATSEVLLAFDELGVKIVEVGVPFSDPVGDGTTIARAAQRALSAGTTLERTLEVCRAAVRAPAIVLFTYLNPIAAFGIERFARVASRSNVSGVVIADLPADESGEIARVLRRSDIGLTLLIAPSTPLERAIAIANASGGFAYVVSRFGVTGASVDLDIDAVERRLLSMRANTRRPLAVGFGVAGVRHVRRLRQSADAIVVGSALVDAIADRADGESVRAAARRFLLPLVLALDPESAGDTKNDVA